MTFTSAFSQSRPDSLCSCAVSYSIKYPKQAEKDRVPGMVIVEFDEEEDCNWSNPVILQKAGYGFDEEAWRVVARTILQHNECNKKCKHGFCQKRKLKQSIRFIPPEE